MIELPEAVSLARQVNDTLSGKRVSSVISQHTPHKLAWYYGEPADYTSLLAGRTVGPASALGSMVEVALGEARLLFSEGAGLRFHGKNEPRPERHQLLIEFAGGTALSASVQMYGGVGCFIDGSLDNPYYRMAKEKPSPLTAGFSASYFSAMVSAPSVQKLSLKAFLATEQRIPGLGNGVLQDILFNAKMHPKKKVNTLSGEEQSRLFDSVKDTLGKMASLGGRDTELDLFGRSGGYRTLLSKNTSGKPCRSCGTAIKKEAYLGGSIYYCEYCQRP